MELTDEEREAITFARAARQLAAEREAAAAAARQDEIARLQASAHVVAHKAAQIHPKLKGDDDVWRAAAYADTITACPDCTRGLVNVDGLLVCSRLVGVQLTVTAKDHDVVACGQED